MTLPVVWLREAATELTDAVAWYTGIRAELGLRFARTVEETVTIMARDPLHFAVVEKNRRRAGVRRFPYGLFFVMEPDRIVVLACFHGKRRPRGWKVRGV